MGLFRANVSISHPSINGPAVNTWHARADGVAATYDAELNGLADNLHDFYVNLQGAMAGGAVFRFDGVWTGIEGDEGDQRELDPWTFTNPVADACLPSATAIAINWRTSSALRTGRGRSFMSPLSVADLQGDGTVTAAALGVFQSAITSFIGDFSGSGNGAFGVYSRKTHQVRDITAGRVNDKFAVLTSRRD